MSSENQVDDVFSAPGGFPQPSSSRRYISAPPREGLDTTELSEDEWEEESGPTSVSKGAEEYQEGSDVTSASSSRGRSSSTPRRPVSRISRTTPRRSAASSRITPASPRGGSTPRRTKATLPSSPTSASAPAPKTTRTPPRQTSTIPPWLLLIFSILSQSLYITARILATLLVPFAPYIFLTLLASGLIYLSINHLPSILFRFLGQFASTLLPSRLGLLSWAPSRDTQVSMGQALSLLPLRAASTPLCALTGIGCQLSLFSTFVNGTYTKTARPWWASRRKTEDLALVARTLTQEARGARDIFDSITLVSQGETLGRLDYLNIWELASTVRAGSSLEDRDYISQELADLGEVARDLGDELRDINSVGVNTFGWLQMKFDGLSRKLALPASRRPSADELTRQLHPIMLELSSDLDRLLVRVERARDLAAAGSTNGRSIRDRLDAVRSSLVELKEREPGWKAPAHAVAHFFKGGELSKADILSRDLATTARTIEHLKILIAGIEDWRRLLKDYSTHISIFSASMMGTHLAASDETGLGPEDEVAVLRQVVEDFGMAVGQAKRLGRSATGGGNQRPATRMIDEF
ncbi:hypothetical protein BCR39DRAFT_549646 [Naematelia encephala]|uniref:Uncharacterized protein n=1 Tax=Naematelia encephala TaxID=71784 RepID=A0A1Y2ALA0_9TREE|nr:hypothetical protein BCR39DRAFT_549646 [Naematelia encephala]